MPADISLNGARATQNLILTTIAQGVVQPAFVMRVLFPLVETATYGGTIIQFDDSIYDDASDDRADDTPYPEIQSGYEGKPYKLQTKGLSYRIPDKRKIEMQNLGINWSQMAAQQLMNKAGLRHEIEAATLATTVANYATTHRITLASGSRFGDSGINPDPIIRTAVDTIANTSGDVSSLVAVVGRGVFSALATKYANNFVSTNTAVGMRQQLTLDTLANLFGFQKVMICDAIYKSTSGARTKVMTNDMVIANVNPAGINGNTLPYRTGTQINAMMPAFGYTYVMQNHPMAYSPYYDNERGAEVYKLDFDRRIVNTGVDSSGLINSGYLIKTAA